MLPLAVFFPCLFSSVNEAIKTAEQPEGVSCPFVINLPLNCCFYPKRSAVSAVYPAACL